MFQVDIKRKEKETTYFVYDTSEIIQTRGCGPTSYMTIDSETTQKTETISFNKGVIHIFENPTPCIIQKEKIEEYYSNFQNYLNPYTPNEEIGFLELIPITKEEYEMLKTLSDYQNVEKSKAKKETKQDIESARQYVRTNINPAQGYRIF